VNSERPRKSYHLSDEIYLFLRYRDKEPLPSNDHLPGLVIRDAREMPIVAIDRALDPQLLVDLARLREHRRKKTVVAAPAVIEKHIAGSAFRGWQLAELIETLDLGMNALLLGPTATGKTLCVYEAMNRLRQARTLYVLEGHESLREHDLLGGYVPVGPGDYQWRDGVVVQAMKAAGILFVDEANRMSTRTLNVLLGILSRRAVVLTEHGSEEVKAEQGFAVVLAMNVGRGYAVNALDVALLNRFQVFLEFRYLPPHEEAELVMERTGIDREVAEILVKVAQETRAKRRNHELSGEITPRQLFAWAEKWKVRAEVDLLSALQAAARVTWLPAVAGTDADGYVREDLAAEMLTLIAAHTPVTLTSGDIS
jgi:MoxR-like ATPase